MSGLTKASILGSTIVAAVFSFVLADRYVLHEQSANNYVWPRKTKNVSILFGGDMMFDRSVRIAIEKKKSQLAAVVEQFGMLLAPDSAEREGDFIFSCIDGILEDADLVVANLEGPITENASISAASVPGDRNNYTFTFPTSTAPLLLSHNIGIVNLGNNHILNFGTTGVRYTISELEKAGVWYFGDPIYQTVYLEHAYYPIIPVFIGYNEFDPIGAKAAGNKTIDSIQTVRNAKTASGVPQIPIVYAHWGEEYATTSSAYSRELAHSFIDAGAEIVIGSHPHVVQEHEIYNGKHIYYSLGNFIFDQYFSEEVKNGLLVQFTFGPEGVLSAKEIPINLGRDRRTCLKGNFFTSVVM